MAFVRVLNTLLRDKKIGKRVVPIVPDESRTFGMEGMFRQFGIFSRVGQLYTPEDAGQLMFYKEDKNGQLLQEGINELGAMSSWIAAATAYSTSDAPMIPFYIYYSMFGFQRVGDLAWAAGDLRARGFLLGGTAGRTTLNGEGLQHEDGHSHLFSAVIPNCVSYDPTFAYEVAVIVADGLRRMFAEQEDVFYYLTLMNENYHHPAMPEGVEEGIVKGLYLFREARGRRAGAEGRAKPKPRAQLMGSGTILREVIAAAEMLEDDWASSPTCGARRASPSCAATASTSPAGTCSTPPRRRGSRGSSSAWPTARPARWSRRRTTCAPSPTRSASWSATGASRARHRRLRPLGLPQALRDFFEVDRRYVVVATLSALARDGAVPTEKVAEAIERYGIDPERPAPAHA